MHYIYNYKCVGEETTQIKNPPGNYILFYPRPKLKSSTGNYLAVMCMLYINPFRHVCSAPAENL